MEDGTKECKPEMTTGKKHLEDNIAMKVTRNKNKQTPPPLSEMSKLGRKQTECYHKRNRSGKRGIKNRR